MCLHASEESLLSWPCTEVTSITNHSMPDAPCLLSAGARFHCTLMPVSCLLQGIWLCEHRDSVSPREVVVTLQGQ